MENKDIVLEQEQEEKNISISGESTPERNINISEEETQEQEVVVLEEIQEQVVQISNENTQEQEVNISAEKNYLISDHSLLENLDYENSGHTGFQKAGNYALKEELPTKTSQLENDSGFLTEHQDLSEYAKNTDIPTKTSELENDSEFITKELDDDFQTSGKIYLTSVKSGVSDAGASRIVFGTPSKTYSYLSSNTSGAFAFSKGSGNITLYPNTGTYNCLMTDCNSDLGRSDRKWKDLYLGGSLKDGTNTIPISNIATKTYVEETIGDIETLLGGI